MKIYDPITKQEFLDLNSGDYVLVEWSDFYVDHAPKCDKLMLYKIHSIKKQQEEVICKMTENHFFNYDMYLQGESRANHVWIIK